MFRLTLHATISEYVGLPQQGLRIPRLKLIYHRDNDGLYSTAFNNNNNNNKIMLQHRYTPEIPVIYVLQQII